MINAPMIRYIAAQAQRDLPYPYAKNLFPPSMYYRFMRLLVQHVKPKLSVVLGVCGGGDCLYLAMGWQPGRVLGIDNANDHPEHIKYISNNCSNFHFICNDSIGVLNSNDYKGDEVDILFIDTIHTYERTMQEFTAWHPHLAPHAVVMLDDLYRDGMQKAWDELPGEKIRLDDLHIGGSPTDGGFGVILL